MQFYRITLCVGKNSSFHRVQAWRSNMRDFKREACFCNLIVAICLKFHRQRWKMNSNKGQLIYGQFLGLEAIQLKQQHFDYFHLGSTDLHSLKLHKPCPWLLNTVVSRIEIFTVLNEVAKVMFLQTCVCSHGGGVCLSACWDTTPPGKDTPWSRHPSRSRHPPGETATAADGTHPTGMHSCYYSPLDKNWTINFLQKKLT